MVALLYFASAEFPERRTRSTSLNPTTNHYVSRDGKRMFLVCLDPKKDWQALCRATGLGELIDDPRFATPAARMVNACELIATLDRVLGGKDLAEWTAEFRKHDVIWAAAPSAHEAIDDPQMLAAAVFAEIDHPSRGTLRTINNPVNLEGVEKTAPRLAPEVGQHTLEVLRALGYDEGAIQALAARGAIAV
jgi:formyl-CoA transferase